MTQFAKLMDQVDSLQAGLVRTLDKMEALKNALRSYVDIDRCENPIRVPLPNPQGYASIVECRPCSKCRYCKAVAALEDD